MTHNEYTTKHKDDIRSLSGYLQNIFTEWLKRECSRQEFLGQYEGRELSDRVVTEDGRVV